jgi:hypothetical protein
MPEFVIFNRDESLPQEASRGFGMAVMSEKTNPAGLAACRAPERHERVSARRD